MNQIKNLSQINFDKNDNNKSDNQLQLVIVTWCTLHGAVVLENLILPTMLVAHLFFTNFDCFEVEMW